MEQEIERRLTDLLTQMDAPDKGNITNSLAETMQIFDKGLDSFDEAIKKNTLYPYTEEAHDLLDLLKSFRDYFYHSKSKSKRFLQKHYFHNAKYIRDNAKKILEFVNKSIHKTRERAIVFDGMRDCYLKHIQLEVMPNDDLDGERIYLSQGILIIPTISGYHVFDISIQYHATSSENNLMFEFEQLTEQGLNSVEEAIKKYADPEIFLGTIAIAKNTETYPLNETVIPIIVEKYEEGLRSNS